MAYGKEIREERLAKGMTLKEAATLIGCSVSYYQGLEKDKAPEDTGAYVLRRLRAAPPSSHMKKSWDAYYEELQAYIKENGRYPLTSTPLGGWVYRQRYAMRRGLLEEDRKAKLEAIQFIWATGDEERVSMIRQSLLKRGEGRWEMHYSELVEYVETNHKLPTHAENKVGNWLSKQRERQKAGTLSPSQKQRLEALGVVFRN